MSCFASSCPNVVTLPTQGSIAPYESQPWSWVSGFRLMLPSSGLRSGVESGSECTEDTVPGGFRVSRGREESRDVACHKGFLC